MAKSKKRKKKSIGNSISPRRYQYLLIVLIDAWEASDHGEEAYWDLGKGERPQKTMSEFIQISKKESIPVVITRHPSSLKFHFPEAKSKDSFFRVKSPEGEIKAEGSLGLIC